MQKDLIGFDAWEDIGMAIINPRKCFKFEGPKWFLEKVIAYYYKTTASKDELSETPSDFLDEYVNIDTDNWDGDWFAPCSNDIVYIPDNFQLPQSCYDSFNKAIKEKELNDTL
jgi:hypothetical protein